MIEISALNNSLQEAEKFSDSHSHSSISSTPTSRRSYTVKNNGGSREAWGPCEDWLALQSARNIERWTDDGEGRMRECFSKSFSSILVSRFNRLICSLHTHSILVRDAELGPSMVLERQKV